MVNNDKVEILEAIQGLATHMDKRFEQVDKRFEQVDKRLGVIESDLASEMSSVRSEIGAFRSEVREGFVKTNDKVDLLTEKVAIKKVISKEDAKEVMSLGPVPFA